MRFTRFLKGEIVRSECTRDTEYRVHFVTVSIQILSNFGAQKGSKIWPLVFRISKNGSLSLRRLTQHGRNATRPPQQRTQHDQPPGPRARPTSRARAHPTSGHLGTVLGEQRLGARASWIQGHWQGLSRLAPAANYSC